MILRWLGRGLLLLLIVLLGFTGWLVTTQRGLNLVVDISQRLIPGLTITEAHGSLFDRLQVQQLVYQPDSKTQYQVKQLQLIWQPQRLLHGQFFINSLHINGVILQTASSTTKQQSAKIELPEIALPLQVVIKDFQLTQLQQLNKQQQAQTLIQSLQFHAQLKGHMLKVTALQLKRADTDFNLQGYVDLAAQYPVQFDYNFVLHLPDINEIKATGRIDGDLQKLTIKQQLSAPFKSSQTIHISQLLGSLHWQATINADKIDLAAIQPKSTLIGQVKQLVVNANGSLNEVSAQLTGDMLQPDFPDVSVEINTKTSDLNDWQLSALLKLPKQSQLSLKGQITGVQQQPELALKGAWKQLRWPLIGDKVQVASPDGDFHLSGSLNKYQLKLAGQVQAAQQQAKIKANVSGSSEQITLSAIHIDALSGSADITGSVKLTTPQPQLNLSMAWQGIQIPETLSSLSMSSKTGQLKLKGTAQAFILQSSIALNVKGQAIKVSANGAGSQKGFNQLKLKVASANAGSLGFDGQLDWQKGIMLSGTLEADKLNPGFISADWPGQLSGKGLIKLQQATPQKLLVNLNELHLEGKLRHKPLTLAVNALQYKSSQLSIDKLQMHSAQSVLTADGQLTDKWQMQWQLNSPDLSDFYPKLAGKLKASGELLGSARQPQLTATVDGRDLVYNNQFNLASVQSHIKLGLAENAPIDGALSVQQLRFGKQKIDKVQLKLTGTQQRHQLDFNAKSAELSIQGTLNGNWQAAKSVWQGRFNKFDLDSKQAGNWQLQQAGQLTLSAKSNKVDEQCLASAKGKICFSAQQQQSNWQAQGDITELPLSFFAFIVPDINQLKGNVNAKVNLNGQSDKQLTGQGKVQLQQAELHLNNADITQTKSIKFKQFALNYHLTPEQTQLQLNIEPDMTGVSAVKGQLHTAAIKTLLNQPQQASLQGQLHLSIADLAQLQINHPQVEDLHGGLDINATIGGTVAKPALDLDAALKQGQMTLPTAGIALKSLAATVKGNLTKGIQFNYQAKSGKGEVTGDGTLSSVNKSWQLKTHVKGNNFQLMNLPEAYVIASPDIQVEMTQGKSQISGQLSIPEAALEPLQFNMPVSPSDDVVIVTKNPQPAKKAIPIQVNLKVKLGDKVKIKAMGFQGYLGGSLLITRDASNLLLGTGDITINKGTYLAYGQQLKVDNGKIHFSGGALDNPDLDIKAVRTGTNYSVGVHIEGPANQPQASLFSDPSMSQDDILSYLLLGHPIKQASAADAAMLASAATGMGIQNGAMLGDQIASTFGLDEFTVTGDSRENAALQIGKYLSPKLYLSYGVGVFQPVTTVQLRYQLSKIWALKAESGTESGVDFMYNYAR